MKSKPEIMGKTIIINQFFLLFYVRKDMKDMYGFSWTTAQEWKLKEKKMIEEKLTDEPKDSGLLSI